MYHKNGFSGESHYWNIERWNKIFNVLLKGQFIKMQPFDCWSQKQFADYYALKEWNEVSIKYLITEVINDRKISLINNELYLNMCKITGSIARGGPKETCLPVNCMRWCWCRSSVGTWETELIFRFFERKHSREKWQETSRAFWFMLRKWVRLPESLKSSCHGHPES